MKFNKQRVLIAPLDWGLGHATRCITLIRSFQKRGWEVLIATDGEAEVLLRQEFPQLHYIKLRGYRVSYSSSRWSLPIKIALQVPKILSTIKYEQAWLQQTIDDYHINLVIADNRYGLYTNKVPCIFITHQLQIKAPFKWLEKKMQQLNYTYISRFTECWVPDAEIHSLAGELSHPSALHPFPLRYIGPLSRFSKQMSAIRYKYLFLISGPEPQRSLLEKKILKNSSLLNEPVLIVRGRPGNSETFALPAHISMVNHLQGAELEKALNSAEYIISRAGYTTIMEIAALQKRSILIATPGQTEQEYLATFLMHKKLAYAVSQDAFAIPATLQQAATFHYASFALTPNTLDTALDDFLETQYPSEAKTG